MANVNTQNTETMRNHKNSEEQRGKKHDQTICPLFLHEGYEYRLLYGTNYVLGGHLNVLSPAFFIFALHPKPRPITPPRLSL